MIFFQVLSRTLELIKIWEILYEYTIKVTAVCIFAYAASLMTMMGTCNLLNSATTTSRSTSTSLNASTPVPKSTEFDWNMPNQETTLANDDSEDNVAGHIEQILSGIYWTNFKISTGFSGCSYAF